MLVGVIGSGGYGTALAQVLATNGHDVTLWSRDKEVVEEVNTKRTNREFLPVDVHLSPRIVATGRVEDLVECQLMTLAIPTQYIRESLRTYGFPLSGKVLVSVAKGVERGTLMRVSEIIADIFGGLPPQYAVLTGPSHAEEVALNQPSLVVCASKDRQTADYVQSVFASQFFRVYTSSDVVGCEIGGSLKNILAIAAGIADGLGMGDNAKAAILTRGLAEIVRLGTALGADPMTFMGLSGIGDLLATCYSQHSRNRRVGQEIGSGDTLTHALESSRMVAEGVWTTDSTFQLARKVGVEMPIVEQVYKILFEHKNPRSAMNDLLVRQIRAEVWR